MNLMETVLVLMLLVLLGSVCVPLTVALAEKQETLLQLRSELIDLRYGKGE